MRKTVVIYGSKDTPLMRKAIEVLSQTLLDYIGSYPASFQYDAATDYSKYRCIFIGTKNNHPYIAQSTQTVPPHAEAYAISVQNDTVIIEGSDDAGVLYGCIDFYNQYIVRFEYASNHNRYHQNIFDDVLPDFAYSSAPTVRSRGLWTWGFVIYDYKGYIDNMVKLKMNTLIMWNDYAPLNAKEIIDYAHSCGIRVIWGFSWGWDSGCKNLSLESLPTQSQDIFRKFKEEYAPLSVDGIYFQTITELKTEYLGGILVADAVTDFVNNTAKLFFSEYPDLEIQFGLHATSVKQRLEIIKKVDARLRIVWEDCGSFPFSYIPHDLDSFEETKAFAEKIATLRGTDDRFGVVTKGLTKLDWSRFEHLDGPAAMGTGSKSWKADRIVRKSKIWRYLQAYWLTNADKVLEMIKAMAEAKQGDLLITALVEDGMFEENIMFPVALYSEMLWDCNADLPQLINQVALREYVTFA
ncbi:MAG: hypothetical protein IJ043_03865 [Clostridia bacterium]|nr:hypothetical protein [Clostridia bacterium]